MSADTLLAQKQILNGANTISKLISEALVNKKGLLIGRHGSLEFQCVMQMLRDWQIPPPVWTALERNAGIFPSDQAIVTSWINEYWNATKIADGMATGWFLPTRDDEIRMVTKYNPTAIQFPLRSLEPYYVDESNRWTQTLKGRRVTVVSSFTQTIEKQLKVADAIWLDKAESILPEGTQWSFVRSFYPPAYTSGSTAWKVESWKEAVAYLVSEVEKTNPEIVLLGCGGLAMIVAAELKKKGIIAIVLGGAIQVLFGIKGGRWKDHTIISTFWNEAWTYPSLEETPKHASKVENSCYWSNLI